MPEPVLPNLPKSTPWQIAIPLNPGTQVTTVRSALRDAIAYLEHEAIPSAPFTAELLLLHTLECDRAWLHGHPEHPMSPTAQEKYASLIANRGSGIPTQHLTGHQEFWGLDFEVTADVLIPRPETEHVIEVALERLGIRGQSDAVRRDTAFQIVDVGTGSGCIAVALACELPNAQIAATDISGLALEVARRNSNRNGVGSRIEFVETNLLQAFFNKSQIIGYGTRSFDLIVSNPPYIGRNEAVTLAREVRDHEPGSALFGGETGIEMYAPLVAQAALLLKPGGVLVLELGHNSADHVTRLLTTSEWADLVITNDLAGIARVISVQRSAT